MSGKKQGNKQAAPVVAAKKVAKIDRMTKVKRDADGNKIMKVARGTARAARREGLVKGWKNVANVKKMAPAANEAQSQAAA